MCILLDQEEEAKSERAAAEEGATAAFKEVEAERDRFKKVIQELKKKLDRFTYLFPALQMTIGLINFGATVHCPFVAIPGSLLNDKSRGDCIQSGWQSQSR